MECMDTEPNSKNDAQNVFCVECYMTARGKRELLIFGLHISTLCRI